MNAPKWNWPIGLLFIAAAAAVVFVLLEWQAGDWRWGGL